jgi:RNA polymerase sigma-70 factor (ECF subfamily)
MDRDENELIHKAQEGNIWAFEQLIHKYDRQVLALAYQLLGNTQDAEDVYQDVFMKIFQKIDKFRFESDFFTWLYRIVVNTAISYRKKRNRQLHSTLEEMSEVKGGWHRIPENKDPNPDTLTLSNEIKEKVDTAMEQLPLMQRTVFVLRFFQDFKIRDIAEITGCSVGTVKNYIFRSTQKMRYELASYMKA